MRHVADRGAEVAAGQPARDELARRQRHVGDRQTDRRPVAGRRPAAAAYAAGLDAWSGLSSSMTSGAFAFGRCQPSAAFVQPAALSAVCAGVRVVGDRPGRPAGSNSARRRRDRAASPRSAAIANASVTIAAPVDRREQRRPDRRVGELGMARSQVEQDGRQRRARVAQHPAAVGRRRGRGSSPAADPMPRRARPTR